MREKTPFAKNMVKAREYFNLTQDNAAKMLGITRSKLGSYEEGRGTPDYNMLVKIAANYSITNLQPFISDENFIMSDQGGTSLTRLSEMEMKFRKAPEKVRTAVKVLLEI